jgi:cytochrome c oxidase subunit 1
MLIGVPTGVKIFNWIATLWGGSLNYKTPLYYGVGFLAMFLIGGITGVMLAVPPFDLQVTDTYFVVGHFHYVLFGGAIFALFAGLFYWWPKMFGRLLSERLGKWQFWLMLVGMNLTFFPMHWIGMIGQPRRTWTYEAGLGLEFWNLVETIGSYIVAVSIGLFVLNVFLSWRNGEVPGNDPWDGHTLEWATTSPPPAHNFDAVPVIRSRRPVWDIKYGGGVAAADLTAPRNAQAAGASDEGEHAHDIHLPPPSFWPLVIAFGITVAGYGWLYLSAFVITAGISVMCVGIAGVAAQAAKD